MLGSMRTMLGAKYRAASGGVTVLQDTFTDLDNTPISLHTPDLNLTGSTWQQIKTTRANIINNRLTNIDSRNSYSDRVTLALDNTKDVKTTFRLFLATGSNFRYGFAAGITEGTDIADACVLVGASSGRGVFHTYGLDFSLPTYEFSSIGSLDDVWLVEVVVRQNGTVEATLENETQSLVDSYSASLSISPNFVTCRMHSNCVNSWVDDVTVEYL